MGSVSHIISQNYKILNKNDKIFDDYSSVEYDWLKNSG